MDQYSINPLVMCSGAVQSTRSFGLSELDQPASFPAKQESPCKQTIRKRQSGFILIILWEVSSYKKRCGWRHMRNMTILSIMSTSSHRAEGGILSTLTVLWPKAPWVGVLSLCSHLYLQLAGEKYPS